MGSKRLGCECSSDRRYDHSYRKWEVRALRHLARNTRSFRGERYRVHSRERGRRRRALGQAIRSNLNQSGILGTCHGAAYKPVRCRLPKCFIAPASADDGAIGLDPPAPFRSSRQTRLAQNRKLPSRLVQSDKSPISRKIAEPYPRHTWEARWNSSLAPCGPRNRAAGAGPVGAVLKLFDAINLARPVYVAVPSGRLVGRSRRDAGGGSGR